MTLPGSRKLVSVGSYRLTGRRLGKGNFAKVEEAIHVVLKTKVALKVMNISEIKEEYVIRNLHREARLMSQLNHPCIATLFETMQNGSLYYLVTELVGGGDLCSYIKAQRGGKLEERSTKVFGRQLISAVAYMHSSGIVHRDLKMENIMLNDTRTQLKIVDFGLSNNWSADSPLRTHCGSPEYAAPELFVTGQLYGPQVDLWSLGVILYGMVLGQLPFLTSRDSRISSQDRRKHLLQQINRGLAPVHRKALAAFTIEFRAMLARLLMPDPAKRIRVVELVRHPWLTDRNRKPLRVTGVNDLETSMKTLILKEVGKLLRTEPARVVAALRAEPYGPIGGVYKILTYKRTLQMELAAKDSVTAQPQASQPPRPSTSAACTGSSLTHHIARFQTINRPITAYICPRQNQQSSTAQPQPTVKESKKNKDWNNDLQGTPSRLRVIATRTINKPNSLRSSANTKPTTQVSTRVQNLVPVVAKASPESLVNRRTKSEPLQQPPPQKVTSTASACAPGGKTTERAVKRRSSRPVSSCSSSSSGRAAQQPTPTRVNPVRCRARAAGLRAAPAATSSGRPRRKQQRLELPPRGPTSAAASSTNPSPAASPDTSGSI